MQTKMVIRFSDVASGQRISKDNELLAVGISNVLGGIVDGILGFF